MDALISSGNDIGGDEIWEILKPETGGFSFAVPELPRLDNLVRLPVFG